ncbi:MAG: hypothetical protein H0X17_16170 [Deltaproteobacteria bacterium]|nr:hypothetical protein [Deltaproteobacteria bacterium]
MLFLVHWLVLGAGPVHAQSAEAEALFTEGDELMRSGKTGPACDAFEASNRAEARAGTLIRLGECREKNRQLASAWSAYKDALTRVKDPKKRVIASAKVKELEPKLSYLTLTVPPASRVEGLTILRDGKPLDAMLWNRALPVDGGNYVITGRAPGHEEWKATVTVAMEAGKVTVDVPPLTPSAKIQVPPPPPPVAEEAVDDEPGSGLSMWTTRRKLAVASAGGGALAVAAGIVLGSQAKAKQSDARALCPAAPAPCADADRANALIDSGQSRALGANIAFGVGAVAVVAAGVLWFTGAPETPARELAIVPTLAPGESGVVVFGRF